MDLGKLMKTPHTAEQLSALWTAYHASRSKDSYSFRYNVIGTRKRHPEEVEPLRKISICFVALPFTYLMGVESKVLIGSDCKRLGRHNHDTAFEGLLE